MNLYSNKQRWKIFLVLVAMVIVGITLWYTNHIADGIRQEERQKVKLWSEAITRRAQLVNFTQALFDQLRAEERKKADLLGNAYNIISDPTYQSDFTFISEFLWSNTTIPVLIYENNGKLWNSVNLPEGRDQDERYIDSLQKEMVKKNPPIVLAEVGQTIYYDDSRLFTQLQATMDDLINSFISETVINAASVPVLVTDSTQSIVLRQGNVESDTNDADPAQLATKLQNMKGKNEPIEVRLPGQGRQYIFYEDSLILRQLKMFPVFQLILTGAFLLVAYLIFSTFRKAEQNQVWVGMAKETAHQLGTPLSSLMAWSSLLEAQGVDQSTLKELNKDIDRLNTITDRFSKIGSVPDLIEENVYEMLKNSIDYLQPRMPKAVEFAFTCSDKNLTAHLNIPLFSWVLENLVKNAVDAMDGAGRFTITTGQENGKIFIELTDTGKGIPKNKWKTVFQPGYTTKKRGWGLGLSLVSRIIEQYHEGKIFVKWSEPNLGTTFRIELRG